MLYILNQAVLMKKLRRVRKALNKGFDRALIVSVIFLIYMGLTAAPTLADSDKIRTSDGVTCEQTTDTGKRVYAETYGSQGKNKNDYTQSNNNYRHYDNDVGARVGVELRFGGADRIDCNILYRYELERQKRDKILAEAEHDIRILEIQVKKKRMLDQLSSGNTGMTLTIEPLGK